MIEAPGFREAWLMRIRTWAGSLMVGAGKLAERERTLGGGPADEWIHARIVVGMGGDVAIFSI